MPEPSGEFLRWTISVIVPAASGLLGVGIGAWLTTRRERWAIRREAYAELLQALGTIDLSMRRALRVAHSRSGDVSKEEENEAAKAIFRAMEQLVRARAQAGLLVSEETLGVLDFVEAEFRAADELGLEAQVRKTVEILGKAMRQLTRVARKDLGR
jgi:hypothetical protein